MCICAGTVNQWPECYVDRDEVFDFIKEHQEHHIGRDDLQRLLEIPKSFELWGQEISVEYENAVHHNEDVSGWTKYRLSKIVLQPRTEQTPITDDRAVHVFLHELMHFLLYCAGEDGFNPPLHQREYFVDRLAGLLHQAIKTMEFPNASEEADNGTRKSE